CCSTSADSRDADLVDSHYPFLAEEAHLAGIPSLGCGSPVEAADLGPGEVVLDLGSGRGLDALRAAERVGPRGRVIGVDMTPEMVWRARADAARLGYPQVEFRLGEIEALPLPEASVDVVISNCVLNLVPDKERAFREAFRVLRPGGRMVVADLVRQRPRPSGSPVDPKRWAACVDGAEVEEAYLERIRRAGFTAVEVLARGSGEVFSITLRARKPAAL
ncbi:MAG: methyltransferase domain-containing protein, partial [Armatimonadota bacterium]|nr:methyltransferase domain-containing protein [Armatimonadota bacterium]